MSLLARLEESVEAVRTRTDRRPDIAMVLGSGLGVLADEVEGAIRIPYAEIPHLLESGVEGHAGELVLGELGGRSVGILSGRFHAYEGHRFERLVHPIRLLARLGASRLVVTNAAGGIRADLEPGDLLLITDHINLLGGNPLVGPNEADLGPRFPDMSEAYSKRLRDVARRAADRSGIEVKEGVYVATLGPSYETPAEIRMMRTIGADVVGMSTVPEVVTARHLGLEVLGLSLVTNLAAGISTSPLSHDEVIEMGQQARGRFVALVKSLLGEL